MSDILVMEYLVAEESGEEVAYLVGEGSGGEVAYLAGEASGGEEVCLVEAESVEEEESEAGVSLVLVQCISGPRIQIH